MKAFAALNRLRVQDLFLIQANTNERTISHKLAEYLQAEFPTLNVDCEYNRHGNEIKRLEVLNDNTLWDDTEAKTVFPDIIVHERNSDRNNLLVIEVKKSSNPRNNHFDEDKLIAFTMEPFQYKFGLFLKISMRDTNDSLKWFENGRAMNE